MTRDDYCKRLHDITWTAGASARYHQILEARFRHLDRWTRIGVAVVALLALVLAVPPLELHWWSFAAALLAAVSAAALNVITFVEDRLFHGEMFRAFSDLRKATLLEEQKTCDSDLAPHHLDRLAELMAELESLNALEPYPDVALQKQCEDDEDMTEYGEIQTKRPTAHAS